MKAVILAAGKGTRMRDLTDEIPKPMLRVQGKPILQHIVEGLVSVGIREFCIVTGWRAEVVENFFRRWLAVRRAHQLRAAGRAGRHGQGAGACEGLRG